MADEREMVKQHNRTLKLIPTPEWYLNPPTFSAWNSDTFTQAPRKEGAVISAMILDAIEAIRKVAPPQCERCLHPLGQPTFLYDGFGDGTPVVACGCHCHTEVFDPYDLLPSVAG